MKDHCAVPALNLLVLEKLKKRLTIPFTRIRMSAMTDMTRRGRKSHQISRFRTPTVLLHYAVSSSPLSSTTLPDCHEIGQMMKQMCDESRFLDSFGHRSASTECIEAFVRVANEWQAHAGFLAAHSLVLGA